MQKKIIRDEISNKLKSGSVKSRLSVQDILNDPRISVDLIFESFSVFEDLKRGKKSH